MRWLLALLGVLLLVWLASGDARAQGSDSVPPVQDIWSARLDSPAPGVVGVWVTLAPDACSGGRFLEARFQYGGEAYGVEAPLPPCPSAPIFLGRSLPAPPLGAPAVATQGYVVEHGLGSPADEGYMQRYPADGDFLPTQALALPASPVPAVAWCAADVGVVSGLWAFAWWRDPSRVPAWEGPT